MPSVYLPYINIALDAFAFVIALIILVSRFAEFSSKKNGAVHFLCLQLFVAIALLADIVAWGGEGHPSVAVMTLVANTVASCACRLAIICFMLYLIASLVKTLHLVEVKDLILKGRQGILLNTKIVDCDYHRFLEGDVRAINSFAGQYMSAYSWAEFTVGYLESQIQKIK